VYKQTSREEAVFDIGNQQIINLKETWRDFVQWFHLEQNHFRSDTVVDININP